MGLTVLPPNGHAPDNKAIAAHLRLLAEQLEAGSAAGVDNAVVILEYSDGDVSVSSCGKPIYKPHLIGLLHMGAEHVMCR